MQITSNTSSPHHLVRRDSSATEFDTVLNRIYFSFILLAEALTFEGGEETGLPGQKKNPDHELQKMPHIKSRKFKPQPRLEPAL